MKNLAILIGVNDYIHQPRIDACKQDIEIMSMILNTGGSFDVHCIPDGLGSDVKDNLSSVIERYKNDDLDQVLFYYTGHGLADKEDFLFLFKDYQESKKSQTSLKASALDNMLRSLNPRLAVKIIDACQSGISYFKSGSSDPSISISQGQFENCRFMFSSGQNQKSWAGKNVSDFTAAFARGIIESKHDEIRYNAITDYVIDYFSKENSQTPQFFNQGPGTEVLGKYSDAVKEKISKLIPNESGVEDEYRQESDIENLSPAAESELPPKKPSIYEVAKKYSEWYFSEEEAIEFVQKFLVALNNITIDDDLKDMFTFNLKVHDHYKYIPKLKSVGNWLKNNLHGEYFAEPTFTTEYYDSNERSLFPTTAELISGVNLPKKKTREVIDGLQTDLSGMPFISCEISLTPLLLNIKKYSLWITYVVSKRNFVILWAFCDHKETSWQNYSVGESTNWEILNIGKNDFKNIDEIVEGISDKFSAWFTEKLKISLNIPE